ncbi:peroxidase-related enzyme [Siccirubricoccus sp. G192]|uniref:peroxidase-related enzyme n=1 Tax=Siccirubricoccus sp. G192 TaxID=2849651 RepID=UPI001C2CAFAC|nr:peroxidase-related enzyme [Siccirubricoccus sp. G192]MBV1798881.1 peroxidase-related enzyme [Siccirubricoccus sp. G192]
MPAAPKISSFPIPTLEEVPEDIRARMLAVQEKAGFIPNVFLLLARRPEEFRAFLAYHDALMDKREGLTAAEREMIVVAISSANQCQYCVVAHGAILRIRAKEPAISEQVAANWRKADITPRQKAMLGFAMKVSEAAHLVGEPDRQALREAGFEEEEIWDIAAITAFFSMSNRLANATDLRPNREFHAMGRG